MAELFNTKPPGKVYWDRQSFNTYADHIGALDHSRTLYIGNLSFYTTEAQIYELFSKIGPVDEVIMGLDRVKKTPCGFCFLVYDHPADATAAINYISGTCLDERPVRVELDPGFKPERQFGRGKSGGQVRDESRRHFDSGRGGKSRKEQAEQEQRAQDAFGQAGSGRSRSNYTRPTVSEDVPGESKDDDTDEPSESRKRKSDDMDQSTDELEGADAGTAVKKSRIDEAPASDSDDYQQAVDVNTDQNVADSATYQIVADDDDDL